MEGPAEELPNYSPNPGHPRTGIPSLRREHRYALQDKNGRDWLSFQIKSRASNSKHAPLYLEGDTIRGEVRLDLIKAETLKGITITVSLSHYRAPPSSHSPGPPDSRGDDGRGTGGSGLSGQDGDGLDTRVVARRQGRRDAHARVLHPHPSRNRGVPGTESAPETLCASADVHRTREPCIH